MILQNCNYLKANYTPNYTSSAIFTQSVITSYVDANNRACFQLIIVGSHTDWTSNDSIWYILQQSQIAVLKHVHARWLKHLEGIFQWSYQKLVKLNFLLRAPFVHCACMYNGLIIHTQHLLICHGSLHWAAHSTASLTPPWPLLDASLMPLWRLLLIAMLVP